MCFFYLSKLAILKGVCFEPYVYVINFASENTNDEKLNKLYLQVQTYPNYG